MPRLRVSIPPQPVGSIFESEVVTRDLDVIFQNITELPKEKYGELCAAVEAFRRARREVLVFAPRR